MSGRVTSGIPLSNVVRVLRVAELALAEGNDNCGGEPDNIYYDALHRVRQEITRLIGDAPDLERAAQALEGSDNPPAATVTRMAYAILIREL